MSRQSRIDAEIVRAVRASRELQGFRHLVEGDMIEDLDVVTGQESPGSWSRLTVMVERKHIEQADNK